MSNDAPTARVPVVRCVAEYCWHPMANHVDGVCADCGCDTPMTKEDRQAERAASSPVTEAPGPEWKVGDYAVLRNFHPPLIARLSHKVDSSGTWHVDAGFGGLASVIYARESEMGRVPDDPPSGGWSSAAEQWRERECGCPKPRRLTQVGACWTCGDQILYRPQRIEGPAIRDPRGVVYTLPTPASHYAVAQAITTWKPDATPLKWDQGFVTETGRYVDRREGKRIAEEAGQIVRPTGGTDRLFSEELWVKEGKES